MPCLCPAPAHPPKVDKLEFGRYVAQALAAHFSARSDNLFKNGVRKIIELAGARRDGKTGGYADIERAIERVLPTLSRVMASAPECKLSYKYLSF